MKKLLLIAALGIGSLAAMPAKAQVSLSVNIGMQPDWGPRGYDYVDYYYLPDVESYYYVPTREYIYLRGGSWVRERRLPRHYRSYDLHRGRKIVINDRDPWMRHHDYRARYVGNYRSNGYRNNYRPAPRVVYRGHNDRNYAKGNHRDNYRKETYRRNDREIRSRNDNHRNRDFRSHNNRGQNNNRGGKGGDNHRSGPRG